MTMFLQFLLATVLWLVFNTISYLATEKYTIADKIPFLDLEVFRCLKCFNFWFSTIAFICIYLMLGLKNYYFFGLGEILTILVTIGRIIEEKRRVINL